MAEPAGPVVLEMQGVAKSYGALRPLRVAGLSVVEGERVSIGGLEAGASEVLVNLVTGASLPDAGEVRVFGRSTSAIADGDEWLDSLEQFGIVSPRGVLLEGSTLLQNLAMPFTLEIDPVPEAIVEHVRDLARRCGIEVETWLARQAGAVPPDVRVRAHLARSMALEPRLLIVEHPTADVPAPARADLARTVAEVCTASRVTALVLTNDDAFAKHAAPRNLRLDGATGQLKRAGRWLTAW